MIRSYFKVAWRNLLKSKFFSAINIFGLAIGMAVALLIGLWVHNEYSFDKFLPGYQSVYQVRRNFDSNGDTLNFTSTSLKLADALRREVPDFEYVVESDWGGFHVLSLNEKKLYLYGYQAGSDFLKIFQFPFKYGNANTALSDPYSIVLTESTAKSLFGDADPINKMVRYENKSDLRVTGIIRDIPSNSSMKFNYVVPFSYLEATYDYVRENRAGGFSENAYQVFAKIKNGASYAGVSQKIRNIEHIESNNNNASRSYVVLQPMKNWHLYNNYVNGKEQEGFMEYVRMFSVIGLLVLLIACINFINITTARSEKRAREVGVRKAIGSGRKELIIQFLAESFLMTFISFLFSLLLVQLALAPFNQLTGTSIHIPWSNLVFWAIMLGSLILSALIAGSRPAFYLSSFRPAKVLKGAIRAGRAATLPRKVLVVMQFTCSVALIISTIIIYRQIEHAKSRPTGYEVNRLMVTNRSEDLEKNYDALKNEMIQKGIVSSVTFSSSPATDIWWHGDLDFWPGKQGNETLELGFILVRDDYFKTMGMSIKEGRDFNGLNDTLSVILNESAVKKMRMKQPLEQIIGRNGRKLRVVGVVKDALMISPYTAADPTIFIFSNGGESSIMYRLKPEVGTADAIAALTPIFNKYNPSSPYRYTFADESYANKFRLEKLIGKLSGIFAILAIFISCLGLFGLAAYMAEQRTKEIGIRKVLGASVQQVWFLLSKDFVILLLVSCVIATPLALYFLQNWLQKYEYRVSIGPWVFIAAAIAAVVITIVTISFQAIKAAVANPVRSLRSE
jgi:putative ABC transport system permease protein